MDVAESGHYCASSMRPLPRTALQTDRSNVPIVPAFFFFLLVCSFPLPAFATYDSLEEIPVESPLYSDLESLALRFGADGHFINRRPWTRGEALAYLEGVKVHDPSVSEDLAFARILREVSLEAPGAREPLWARVEDEDRRLEISPYVQVRYREN